MADISLLDHYAAGAPSKPAEWYQPKPEELGLGPRPEPPPAPDGLSEEWFRYCRAIVNDILRDTQWAQHMHPAKFAGPFGRVTTPPEVRQFECAVWGEWLQPIEEWKLGYRTARLKAWPFAWAEMMVAERKRRAGA